MGDEIYYRLAKVLDTLPSGFPSTESGVEIKLLKKVFTPEEADLFCDLRVTFETAEQIAKRTGRPLDGLDEKLTTMWKRGQLFGIDFGTVRVYRMLPWIFGIFEFQLPRLDREFCELNEEYSKIFGKQFFSKKPQMMQIIPVEKEISARHQAMSYELVSSIIENSQDFSVNECVCKKESRIMGKACERPLHVCLAIAPVPGVFERLGWGRPISKEEAYALLTRAEEQALVHMTYNTQTGNMFICNCCSCCCGVLRSINEMGMPAADVVNSHYYAHIDPETCAACGTCADERCQVNAIEEGEDAYRVIVERCIGCGLCVSTCPSEAIRLVHKDEKDTVTPPLNEEVWYEERGHQRGVDFSTYK
jgi:Fe-S-cluster-containing hydrogenase component 2